MSLGGRHKNYGLVVREYSAEPLLAIIKVTKPVHVSEAYNPLRRADHHGTRGHVTRHYSAKPDYSTVAYGDTGGNRHTHSDPNRSADDNCAELVLGIVRYSIAKLIMVGGVDKNIPRNLCIFADGKATQAVEEASGTYPYMFAHSESVRGQYGDATMNNDGERHIGDMPQ